MKPMIDLINTSLNVLGQPSFPRLAKKITSSPLSKLSHFNRTTIGKGSCWQYARRTSRGLEVIDVLWECLACGQYISRRKFANARDAVGVLRLVETVVRRLVVRTVRMVGHLYLASLAPELPPAMRAALLSAERGVRLICADWLEEKSSIATAAKFRNWTKLDPGNMRLVILNKEWMKAAAHEDFMHNRYLITMSSCCCVAPR